MVWKQVAVSQTHVLGASVVVECDGATAQIGGAFRNLGAEAVRGIRQDESRPMTMRYDDPRSADGTNQMAQSSYEVGGCSEPSWDRSEAEWL